MKNLAILFLLISFSLTANAQKSKLTSGKKASSIATAKARLGDEKTEFEKAVAETNAATRIAALQKFIKNFPKSNEKNRVLELIVSGRAEIADEKLRLSETASGVELFGLAVKEAPKPISDKLFTEIILQIPTNLFFRGERDAALKIARSIEEKVASNAKQLLGLATFYLGTENASEAKRLAEKAIQIEPELPAAYQTLGIANRLNFQLEEAAAAYTKALELDANSVVSKRSLAEMKRATGKADEAISLYGEILAKDAGDAAAHTGLTLSLFDTQKRAEAEAEMQKSLAQNPNNLFLLVGAAYWYAAHEQGAKAIELAEKAIAVEPRYTWARIALARGLMRENRPLEAERALLVARQYGNFPTLDYEIAAARLQAGFFRDAADELRKTFTVKDDVIKTRLGGRVPVEAKNFVDLLALERRASIFEPNVADTPENAQKLKSLLDFFQKLDASEPNEIAVSEAADEFVKGDDKMKFHRQLFVANRLLEKRVALPKVLELTKSAVASVDSALEVANPSAAVLADELYESRKLALTKGELVVVPNIPRQTLSGILRGRIEEISGWVLFQENKPDEAAVRLKRAVSVLPEKSAWWRSSMWRLGAALDSGGKSNEALDAYIKSYTNQSPDTAKHIIIESLYRKIYGNTDGLEQKIGANPIPSNNDFKAQTEKNETVAAVTKTEAAVTEKPNLPDEIPAAPEAKPKETPEISPAVKETPQPVAKAKQTTEVSTNQNTETPPKVETNTETEQTKSETNQTIAETTQTIKNSVAAANSTKPLFEPIIITVPKSEAITIEKDKNNAENVVSKEKSGGENSGVSKTRRRRVETESETNEETEKTSPCEIKISQETVSILSSGGSLGLLVSLDDEDLDAITAASSSPKDVEVVLQPETNAVSNRASFVVKSISSNKGEYSVTFELPCGKREVLVRVR